MQVADLDYNYPESLVATEPKEPCRIFYGSENREILWEDLYSLFQAGDLLVINDTQVEKRRVFSTHGLEFLFLKSLGSKEWSVLFPARGVKDQEIIHLPDSVEAKIMKRGLPQVVTLNQDIGEAYFKKHGELALPPYIQKARGERHNRNLEDAWYQSPWAKVSGSVAAPTASLHFKTENLNFLKSLGVGIEALTLHVGMGTWLPIKSENLNDHIMHSEYYTLPDALIAEIEQTKSKGARVWALGTTVARALESYALSGQKTSETQLFIRPGFNWNITGGLLTNFHQPKSTLLSLVAAFAGDLEKVKAAYQIAIDKNFRLFSYGDLTVWIK
jgi:S-adenosylmethionine:tRNA ribosyltransferase-isomerase